MTRPVPQPRAIAGELGAYLPGRSMPGKLKLSSNESPFGPTEHVIARLTEELATLNRYPNHTVDGLREALAALVSPGSSRAIGAEDVVVGNGSVALLRQCYEAYLDPGDEVVLGWRSFEAYPLFSAARGAIEVQLPLVSGLFDMDAVAAAVTDRTKLVVLTSPNNPSGSVIAHDAVVALLDQVPDGCLVVVDNAYAELDRSIGGVRPLELLDRPNLLVLRTLSKVYALAGLRVGYGIGHPDVVRAVDAFRPPFDVNSLAQAAAIAALEEPEVTEEVARGLVTERDRCVAALWAGGLPVGVGQGNFVWLASGDETSAFNAALFDAGILVREFRDEGLRISIGRPEDDDRWVASVLDTWQSDRFAGLRERTAPVVAEALEQARTRGIDLAADGGAGAQDLELQASTFAAGDLHRTGV